MVKTPDPHVESSEHKTARNKVTRARNRVKAQQDLVRQAEVVADEETLFGPTVEEMDILLARMDRLDVLEDELEDAEIALDAILRHEASK